MQEKLLKSENIIDTKSAEKYLLKYLQDLQCHFSLNNSDVIKILQSIVGVLKQDNRPKRWWHFFYNDIK